MDQPVIEPTDERPRETHHHYSCWPFPWGGRLCGLCLLAIGAGLMLQQLFPDAATGVWGAVLLVFGAAVLLTPGQER